MANELQKQKLSKFMKEEEIKKIQDSQDAQKDVCCNQCDLPVPLVCWRNKIRHDLFQNNIKTPEEAKGRRNPDLVFIKVDGWRKKLDLFITQNGTTLSDRTWQMRFAQFSQLKQDQQALKANKILKDQNREAEITTSIQRMSMMETTLTNDDKYHEA